MDSQIISDLISQHWRKDIIHSTNILINSIDHQPDEITITLIPEVHMNFALLGKFLNALDDAIINDGYGDLVAFDLRFTSYHEENDDQYQQVTITPEIDS